MDGVEEWAPTTPSATQAVNKRDTGTRAASIAPTQSRCSPLSTVIRSTDVAISTGLCSGVRY
jgi:hypothetical protein